MLLNILFIDSLDMAIPFLDFYSFQFCRVLCKILGSDKADDPIFTEHDLNYCVDITSTKDSKYITINSNSRTSSEEGYSFLSLSS